MKRIVSLAVIVAVFGTVACTQETAKEDKQTITGRIDGQAVATNNLRTLGQVSASNGQNSAEVTGNSDGTLHVVAHKLGKQGSADVSVDGIVAADGSFSLDLDRSAQYVFEVERGKTSLAFLGWKAKSGNATTTLAIAASTKGKGAVSLGKIKVVGNGAAVEHSPLAYFDENDVSGIDLEAKWFVSTKGALMSADQALEEAGKALEEAGKALEEAGKALDEAGKRLDQAGKQADEAAAKAAAAAKAGNDDE